MGAPKVNVPAPLPAPAQAIQPKAVDAPELEMDQEGDQPSEELLQKRKGKKSLRVDRVSMQPLSTSTVSGLQIPKM